MIIAFYLNYVKLYAKVHREEITTSNKKVNAI